MTKSAKKSNKSGNGKSKTVKGQRGRKPTIPADAKITILTKKNPRREGTAAHKRYALYKSGMTVGAYLKAGGKRGALKKDIAKKHISIAAPKAKPQKEPKASAQKEKAAS